MKILIVNGSPKGEYSITLQTALYLKKKHPEHEFEVLHAGKKIRSYEKDFAPAADALDRAELVVFAYPVYTFLVPAQLHRFVELMHEHRGKYRPSWATQLSTSKHFYDITAHAFMKDNLADLGYRQLEGLSASRCTTQSPSECAAGKD